VGGLLAAVVSLGFVRSVGAEGWIEHGRSLALAALCVASASAIAGLSRLRTRASRWVASGTLAISALLIQTPGVAKRLHLTPLHLEDWIVAALAGALVCLPLFLETARVPRMAKSATRSGRPVNRPGT
jgi:Ca2+-transporting ATPase